MIQIKKLLLLIGLFAFTLHSTFAISSTEIAERYSRILDSYESKYTEQQFYNLLDKLDKKINFYLIKPGISSSKKSLLRLLKSENAKRKNQSTAEITFSSNSEVITQKYRESTIRKSLTKDLILQSGTTITEAFKDAGYEVKIVNSKFEFVEDSSIKKIIFESYVPVDTSNYKGLLRKNIFSKIGTILIYDGKNYYIPKGGVSYETKRAYSESSQIFLDTIHKDKNYSLEDGVYYTYSYDTFLYFKDTYGFYRDDLESNNIDSSESVLLIEGGKYKIVRSFEKKRLLSASVLDGVEDKESFINVVIKDSNYTSSLNNDQYFMRLKNKTKTLTSNGSTTQKIEAIYDYILDNHYYYEDFSDGTEEIFSGIDTYRNGYGVCDGYSKLMYYMLAFAGIDDIEHIRGYVIDAVDFPEIGHAWVRIGSYYYDPTFDDPIGQQSTLEKEQYRYFKLPRDLAYTNRVDGFDVDDDIKEMSLNQRKKIVENNLFSLLNRYNTSSYNLLKPFRVKQDLGIGAGETVTLDTLKKELQFYRVASDFSFTDENGKQRRISQLRYYVPDDENIPAIIELLGQDFTKSVLLEWDLGDGNYEYRLAYEFVIR